VWFCHPIYTEELSNSMLEVMACGIPVPATPVGAISDVIIDDKV
jgi:glycosyltransferase involved in cell wall biosynthesis